MRGETGDDQRDDLCGERQETIRETICAGREREREETIRETTLETIRETICAGRDRRRSERRSVRGETGDDQRDDLRGERQETIRETT